MDESNRRIVILGKTGVGKSSVANTILGEEVFNINDTANSETRTCQAKTRSVNGRSNTLIDTPGFFDTDTPAEEMKSEIIRCIIECAPGPHAFLIVLKVDKFTEQEQAVITKIDQYFSEEIFKYATVLFTHGDQLRKGQTVEEFVHDNQNAIDLLEKCGERCHVIDNKYWKDNQKDEYRNNQFQVKELLKTIDEMVKAHKGSCYTNEMLQAVEEDIQQEVEELIRQSSGTLTQEEATKQAKDKVFNKLNIKLAGIATGVLLGALLGAVTMVGQVLLMLTEKLSEPGQIKSLVYRAEAAGVIGAVGGTAVVGGAVAGAAAVSGAVAGAAAVSGAVAGAAAVSGAVAGAAAVSGAVAGAAAVSGAVAGAVAVSGAVAGTVVVGGAAAAVGGAVAGAVAVGAIAAVFAVAGAVKGGVAGYHAAKGADSPREAAQGAAKAAMDQLFPFKRLCFKDETESEPLIRDELKKGN